MNERTIQIDVIGKIEGTQFMKCKLYTNENIVIIMTWKDEFLRMPFDVTKRKKWADYVAECHATGKEIDYDNYDWDK